MSSLKVSRIYVRQKLKYILHIHQNIYYTENKTYLAANIHNIHVYRGIRVWMCLNKMDTADHRRPDKFTLTDDATMKLYHKK